ncbi:MAG TPA: type II CAAX endopeptidase family protein [Acholeplasma sp.]|nr:type II CAAX endopeptidase family protein [Acholeplasma sp.]
MNQNEDFDFDELFENEKKKTDFIKKSTNISKQRSIIALVVYLLVSLLGGLLVSSITIAVNPNAVEQRTMYEETAYQLEKNVYGIAYMPSNTYLTLNNNLTDELIVMIEANDYVFLANKENKYLIDDYLLADVLGLYNGTTTKWQDVDSSKSVERFQYEQNQSFLLAFNTEFANGAQFEVIKAYIGFTAQAASTLQFIVYVMMMITIVPMFFSVLRNEWQENKMPVSAWLSIIVIGYFYMIAGNLVSNVLSQFASSALNYEMTTSINQQAIEEMIMSSYGILMIIPVVFFAPIVEELVFRKAIFSLFKSDYTALIISSLLFGLIHVSSEASIQAFIVNGIAYVVSGFALGYVYIKNKHNIWASIFVHAFSNALSVVLIMVSSLL